MSTLPTNPDESTPGPQRAKGTHTTLLVLGALLVAGIAAWLLLSKGGGDAGARPTAQVTRGPLTISVTESGTIASREKEVIKCEVEGRTTILWLIPEGTHVKKGDLLFELDATGMEDEKTKQQITVLNAESAYIRAKENLAVTKSQSESDISKAQLDLKFARIDLEKYTAEQGEYEQELQQAEAQITLAKEELHRANEKLEWSAKLEAKGFITRTELEADELAAKRAKVDVDLAQGKLDLLKKFTHTRKLDELNSDIEQAEMALDRVQRKATADLVQAEAELRAKESEYNRQTVRLDKLVENISNCIVKAPVAGMVVYSTTGQGNWRGNAEPLHEGQEVRERQDMIFLPAPASIMAEVKVHESSLRKVAVGMTAKIVVDSIPGKVFQGRVEKIGLLPDAQSAWLNPDLKVYSTEIHVEAGESDLRPGMTCRAEIIVEVHQDALSVPIYSVLRVNGKPTVYVDHRKGREPEPRQVEVGLDNNRMIHILSGLQAGEYVLLDPPLAPSAVPEEDKDAPESDQPAPVTPPKPAAPAATAETTEQAKPAAAPEDWTNLTPEERKKKFDALPEEQRRAIMERMRQGGREGRGARNGDNNAQGNQ